MTADPAAAMWAETLGPVDFRGAYEALYGPVAWDDLPAPSFYDGPEDDDLHMDRGEIEAAENRYEQWLDRIGVA